MKRLIKKSEIYSGFLKNDDYYEIYINPTDKEIEEVRRQDPANAIRGVIYSDGTKIIWPGFVVDHYEVNRYSDLPIDVDQFRFAWDPSATDKWLIDGTECNSTRKILIEYINNNKNFLSKIGNILEAFYLMPQKEDFGEYYINNENEEII